MVHGPVEQDEPMPRGGLAFRAIGPEFRQNTGIVTTRHDVGCISSTRGRVQRMSRTRCPPFQPIVKRVHLTESVRTGCFQVALAPRTDIQHDTISRMQVGTPERHHREAPGIGIRDATDVFSFPEIWGSTAIEEQRPIDASPHHIGPDGIIQGKRQDIAPFRSLEVRSLAQHIAGLIHEDGNGQGLPCIGVDQIRIAGLSQLQVRVDGDIVDIGVIEVLIGPILQAELNQLCSQIVAEGSRSVRNVLGEKGSVVPQFDHQGVETGQ